MSYKDEIITDTSIEFSKDDIRRGFVAGAKWWEFVSRGATMWSSDVREAEEEATRRYASQQADSE